MFNFSFIKSSFKIILEELLNIIYKDNCVHCGKSNNEGVLCKNCAKTVQILPCFAHKVENGVQIFSCSIYKDAVKSLIQNLKFNHKRSCAVILANILDKYYKKLISENLINNTDKIVIVPVPVHKSNINKRGYNNVYETAKIFGQNNNLKIECNILTKTRYTEPMYKLKANQRENNIKNSFKVDKKYYNGETLIIIDDIYTTGTTAREIIKEFKKENINNIYFITLSKAV